MSAMQDCEGLMTTRSKRVFAIGFKDQVELRSATAPPKRSESSFQKVVQEGRTVRETIDQWPGYQFIYKMVPRTLTITTTTYRGGKVLGTMRTRKFQRLLHASVSNGGIMELLPDQADLILKELS